MTRNMIRSPLGALAVAVLAAMHSPSVVAAQVCMGNPALGAGAPVVLTAGLQFVDNATAVSAGAVGGGQFFGGGSLGRVSYDGINASSTSLSGLVGAELAIDSPVSLCAVGSVGRSFGLEVLGADVATLVVSPGFAVGGVIPAGPTLDFVPSAMASLQYARTTLSAEGFESESTSETYGLVSLGFALSVKKRINVGPALSIPVGLEDGETSFGITASFGVGGG
jgi:hypothetical protein